MPGDFLDTNILLYAVSDDFRKADITDALIVDEAIISVQVLNEFASVARGKMHKPWTEVHRLLNAARSILEVQPITIETHEEGLRLSERYGLSVYDGMIVASALAAGCSRILTEDLHYGLLIDGRLRVENPFAPA